MFANSKLKQNMKHEMVLERLLDLGVTKSQQGNSIYDLNYDELKYELVLAEIRVVDVGSSEEKWF